MCIAFAFGALVVKVKREGSCECPDGSPVLSPTLDHVKSLTRSLPLLGYRMTLVLFFLVAPSFLGDIQKKLGLGWGRP